MKKIFIMAALAAGVLSACSEDEHSIPSSVGGNTIEFSTRIGAKTRSAESVTSITKFTVSAVNADNSSFYSNEEYTYDNAAGVFKSTTPHYWPTTGTLSFYAISRPGTASVDATNVPKYSYSDWAGEEDLVAATVRAGVKEIPYPLHFQHLTSQVNVSAEPVNKTEELTYKLVSVIMTTLSTGTYSFDEQTAGQGSWTIDNTKTSSYSYEDALPMSFNQNGQVELSSCCWNILPVTDGTIVFDIEYQVYQNGKLIADFTGAHSKSCEAEAPGLLAGKRYTYNFLLSRGTDSEITFTTTMEDWKDGDSSDKTLDTQYSDYFFPSDGTENGYEYIDLDIKDADGKSLLFATRNVGAKHPMQAGKFFQWGCVAPCDNDSLDWSDYKYTPTLTGTATSGYGEGSSVFTKYNTDDDIRVLALEDDAAHQIMGGNWRMPTHEEWALLMAQTHVEKTYMGTVYGLKVTSKTDASKYIFLPAAGMVGSQGLNYINDRVRYWSSTVAGNRRYAYFLSAAQSAAPSCDSWMTLRCFGMNLRGVILQ